MTRESLFTSSVLPVASEEDASAIVFPPRGGSRWIRLLTGDTALDLITENDRPVVTVFYYVGRV